VATAAAAHSGFALNVLVTDLLAPGRLRRRRVELVHDVAPSRYRATGQPAREDLGEHAEVRRDSVAGLSAAARPAKAGDHLVHDQQHATA
jgi:hypothetical protein